MKKVFVSMALAVLALGSQAQVLKNDLLKGYKVGDTLEKTVYDDKRAKIPFKVFESVGMVRIESFIILPQELHRIQISFLHSFNNTFSQFISTESIGVGIIFQFL